MRKKQQMMDFGAALRALKRGKLVARQGWNGKGMHIRLETFVSQGQQLEFEPCIVMWTAQKKRQPGWLASQADMLAEDWVIVEQKWRRR